MRVGASRTSPSVVPLELVDRVGHLELGPFEADIAGQGVAVAVQAGGAQAQDDVARTDLLARDDLVLFDDADREARHVEFALAVGVGHFGGFAAQQGAIRLPAAGGDAFDHLGDQSGLELVQGHVVEEEQRLGTHDEHVVDAHRDEVDADGVELLGLGGHLDLAADAVGAGDEHGIAVVFLEELLVVVEAEQAREAPGHIDDPRPVRAGQVGLDVVDHDIVGVDVHAGLCVADVFTHWQSGSPQTCRVDSRSMENLFIRMLTGIGYLPLQQAVQ